MIGMIVKLLMPSQFSRLSKFSKHPSIPQIQIKQKNSSKCSIFITNKKSKLKIIKIEEMRAKKMAFIS